MYNLRSMPRRTHQSPAAPSRHITHIVKPAAAAPTVAIIGAGRLGTALGLALAARGYEITAFVAAHRANALRAARTLKRYATRHEASPTAAPRALSADELHRLPPASLYLFTTPDDQLAHAARALAKAVSETTGTPDNASATRRKTRIALHTSGARASDELAALRDTHGFAVGSLHPLAAVTPDASAGAKALAEAFYCVEGDAAAVRAARRIVRSLGGRAFTIDPSKKSLYHSAAVMTSGHAVALFDLASELLTRCGLDSRTAREVLLPLLASAVRNLEARPPAQALTGTFARADAATLRLHLAALRDERIPLASEIYRLLGRRSIELAKANGVDADALVELGRALDED